MSTSPETASPQVFQRSHEDFKPLRSRATASGGREEAGGRQRRAEFFTET